MEQALCRGEVRQCCDIAPLCANSRVCPLSQHLESSDNRVDTKGLEWLNEISDVMLQPEHASPIMKCIIVIAMQFINT